MRKALNLTKTPEELRYAVCACEEITHADPDLLTISAADIFTPGT
jgi:hypothetical protein